MDAPAERAAHGLQDYFQTNEDQHQATQARLAALEQNLQERDAMVDEMSRGLEAAWDRVEVLEVRLERYAQGDALQAKMAEIAESYQSQVEMMGREIEEVRESLSDETAVRHAVDSALEEREASDAMREELMTKQRRSLWLIQAFSRVRFAATSNLKQHVLSSWWEHCLVQRRRRNLVTKTVGRLMMLREAQTFNQWAGVVRLSVKHRLSAEISGIEEAQEAMAQRVEEELGSSSTLARLAEVEKMVAEETGQTRTLVQDFFEYQQQFEVDLVADRAQVATEQRARLATLKVDVTEELEHLETRVREELVGCVVRCDGISREIDNAKADRAEAEDEMYASRAKAEAIGKQLAGIQKSHAQSAESERIAMRRLEDKVLDLQTRSGQTQKDVHACRAELRAAAAAAAKARSEAAMVRHVDYDYDYGEATLSDTAAAAKQPAVAQSEEEGRSEDDDASAAPAPAAASTPRLQQQQQQAATSTVSSGGASSSSKRYVSPGRGSGSGRPQSPGRYTRTPRAAAAAAANAAASGVQQQKEAQVEEGIPQPSSQRSMSSSGSGGGSGGGGGGSLRDRAPALPGRDGNGGGGGGSGGGSTQQPDRRPGVYRPKVSARRNSRDRSAVAMD